MTYTVMANPAIPGWHHVLCHDGLRTTVFALCDTEAHALRVAALLNAHGLVDVPLGTLPTT